MQNNLQLRLLLQLLPLVRHATTRSQLQVPLLGLL